MTADNAIELKEITKQFPGVLANDSISLEIKRGEIHAIVGENGAGKSTLMKIIAGLYQPDKGEIRVAGKKVEISSPKVAISLGIGMVHQHFTLIPRFSVLENIILGSEPAKLGIIAKQNATRELEKLCERYRFNLNLSAVVADLSVGQQQQIEILKVLYREADTLVFDEPTAVLAPQEVTELFVNLKNLKAQGKTIIFISHKLDEVLELADRITVLRRGQLIGTLASSEATKPKLAEMMVGRPVVFRVPREESTAREPLLELKNVTVAPGKKRILDGVSMTVRRGELYGLAGIEGNGQKELVEAIMGLRSIDSGAIIMDNQDVSAFSVTARRQLGIAYIPEDRHRRGLVLPLKLWENLILGKHHNAEIQASHILKDRDIKQYSSRLIDEYDIRTTGPDQVVGTMSGGNQQKAILAREFSTKPKLIVASQPTRGLDVAAIEFVHQQLLAARASGCAVLVVSADLEEILSISDRIGVIYNGQIAAELTREEASPELLGEYMTGSRQKGGRAS